MLVASGGGGAGGTPWGMLTMQQMQALIQNPDTDRHYELLTGWKQSADLLVEHRWQVQNYRDNLASVWPPEKNAASAAYIARLDELITNLSETYEAAISNHDAFAAATLTISLAQKEMDDLAREYESNEQLLLTHTAPQQSASGQPQPTPSPSGEQPPVAPGRQEALHQKAVTLLNGVSADLAQAQVNIRTPPPYGQKFVERENDPLGGDSYVPPPIPPITPSYANDGIGTGVPNRPLASFPTNPGAILPPPTPVQQPGLILGGANPSPLIPPPLSVGPTPPLPSGAGPIATPGLIPPGNNAFVPTTSNGVAPPAAKGVNRGGIGAPRDSVSHTNAIPSGRALPPGGIIGSVPGLGSTQPASSRTGTQRINPVGGLISGSAQGPTTGTRAAGAREHTIGGAPHGHAGSRRTGRDDPSSSSWDPDNPWETAEGVDPVVLPSRERRIDPGPVIGL